MSGIINMDFIQANASLDRRRLKELFLDATKRVTQVFPHNIGLNQFTRGRWEAATFEEMWYESESGINYRFPDSAHHVPGSNLELRNDDSYLPGRVVWSLHARSSTSSMMLTGWPVVDGEALWAAQDWAIRDSLLDHDQSDANPDLSSSGTPFSASEDISLGGICNFLAGNGRSMTGVLLFSVGAFSVLKSQIAVKAVGR